MRLGFAEAGRGDIARFVMRYWLIPIFIVVAAISGVRLVYGTPIGQVPDEPSHIARALGLLRGEVLGSREHYPSGEISGVWVNWNLETAASAEIYRIRGPHMRLPPGLVAKARAIRWSPLVGFVPASASVVYFPAFYLPATLGVVFGRAIGQRPLDILYTGRLFMLIAYIVFGGIALATARFGRPLLFALLTLPTTLGLAASFNQDGQLVAATALCGALLTWDSQRFPAARWIAAGLFGIVVCSKPPYGFLLFCALVPIMAPLLGRRVAIVTLFAVPAILWVAVMMKTSFTSAWQAPYHPGPLWPGDPGRVFHTANVGAAARVLLAHPGAIVWLPFDFIERHFTLMLRQMIGVLGWTDLYLRPVLYRWWYVALLGAVVATVISADRRAIGWSAIDAVAVLGLAAATSVLMELALYLSWSHVGATQIKGVQGRYYLPLIPFLMLAIPRFEHMRWTGHRLPAAPDLLAMGLTLPAVGLAVYDCAYLPSVIHSVFF